MIHIPENTRWSENGITVAGCGYWWMPVSQLDHPHGLCLDDRDSTLFIADCFNHRIVAWAQDGYIHWGRIVAGGNGKGNQSKQLNYPTDVLIDKKNDYIIICDQENRRVTRWSLRNGTTEGETIINQIDCHGLAIDNEGSLYVTDIKNHEVRRYRQEEKGTEVSREEGVLVAGGNGKGNGLNQFDCPKYVFVDSGSAIYVSDYNNHRVMKWMKGAIEGIAVVGGGEVERNPIQLLNPEGIFVDADEAVYVADAANHQVTRWRKGKKEKSNTIVGGNGYGGQANQLDHPVGLSFDRDGHLYVVDHYNHRVQRFNIKIL